METIYNNIPRLILMLTLTSIISVSAVAQEESLAPDQNPNYKVSMDKYMAKASELTKNQGETVHNTYTAIDDVKLKKDKKEARVQARRDRRVARISARRYNNMYSNYSPYYGFNGIGYNAFNYPLSYGYGFYNSAPGISFNYNHPLTYGLNTYRPYGVANAITTTALLGLGMYWWLR